MSVWGLLLAGLVWSNEPPDPGRDEAVEIATAPVDVEDDPEWVLRVLSENGYGSQGAALALLAVERHPDDPAAPRLRLNVSRVQRELGLRVQEVRTLERGRVVHPDWEPWFELALMDAHYAQENFAVLAAFHEDRREWDAGVRDAAHCYGAWGRLAVGNERGAQSLLAKVRGDLQEPAVQLGTVINEFRVPQRSPGLASALSVVPGMGHAYAGDASGAVGNLLLVGGLGGGAAALFLNDEYTWGAVLATLGGLAWLNGIFEASSVTLERNRMRRMARFSMLRERFGPASTLEEDGAPLRVSVGEQ